MNRTVPLYPLQDPDSTGESWGKASPERMPAALPGEGAFAASGTCLVVHAGGIAWFGTGGAEVARVFRSVDSGRSWTVHRTPIAAGNSSSGIFSLAFRIASEGVAVGGDYKRPELGERIVATTSDGGHTWTRHEGPGPGGFRSAVVYARASAKPVLIAVGPTGSDLSNDGGMSWVALGKSGFHAAACAGSTAGCFAAGERAPSPGLPEGSTAR